MVLKPATLDAEEEEAVEETPEPEPKPKPKKKVAVKKKKMAPPKPSSLLEQAGYEVEEAGVTIKERPANGDMRWANEEEFTMLQAPAKREITRVISKAREFNADTGVCLARKSSFECEFLLSAFDEPEFSISNVRARAEKYPWLRINDVSLYETEKTPLGKTLVTRHYPGKVGTKAGEFGHVMFCEAEKDKIRCDVFRKVDPFTPLFDLVDDVVVAPGRDKKTGEPIPVEPPPEKVDVLVVDAIRMDGSANVAGEPGKLYVDLD